MTGYVPDATIAAFQGNFNLGVFFRLGTTPAPILVSLSANDMPIVMPGLDAPGSVYLGAGKLLTVPALETLINGIASTVSFSLQGLDPVASALMLDSNPEVLGAPVAVGIAPLDARWQPAAPVVILWSGVADMTSQAFNPGGSADQQSVLTLTLTAMSGDQARQLGNNLTYSDAVQQSLSPGDTFCQRVVRYYASQMISWPRFS